MSDLILNNLMLMLTLMFAFTTIWITSKPSLRTQSSSPYHLYFVLPLPADETTAVGKDLNWCTRGHVPDSQIKLQLRL